MIDILIAAGIGALLTLAVLYLLGKRHQRHAGRSTGPNSRMPVSENVIVKKG